MSEEKTKQEKPSKQTKDVDLEKRTYTPEQVNATLESIRRALGSPQTLGMLTRDYPSRSLLDWLVEERLGNAAGIRPQVRALESEISKLRSEINEKAQAIVQQTVDAKQKEQQIGELRGQVKVLEEKERLSHLLNRVGDPARQKLLDSSEFRAQFDRDSPSLAYVLSIDIRRSTELMLKAREPKLFAQFLMTFVGQLRQIVLENYGIFDKFTGDGILAFFPEFYSGSDAGYFALKAASNCHAAFDSHYGQNKHCFISVLKDTGLGIGLDYGPVQIVQLGGEFTVVGTPVVYACRMAGADARHTYLNQPAYEQLFERYSAICDFDECEINIKHEGKTLAYCAQMNGKVYEPKLPEWSATSKPLLPSKTGKGAKDGDSKK